MQRNTQQPSALSDSNRRTFADFYAHHFLAEHRHPANVVLHVIGTLLGLALIPFAFWIAMPWLALLFPIVHAAPGLIGHKLFEANAAVGDVRITRKDFPLWWFIAGNHLMTAELVTRGFYWRARNSK